MPNNNGIITGSVGIGSVQQVLGSSAHDAKSLCTYNGLNKFSAHKPIEVVNHVAALTDTDYRATNWGITMQSYSTLPAAIRALKSSGIWSYNAVSTVGRLTDFENYNHNAIAKWFDLTPKSQQVYSSSNVNFNYIGYNPFEGSANPVLEMLTWGILSGKKGDGSADAVNFGFALSQTPFSTSTADCYYYAVTGVQTIEDMEWEKIHIVSSLLALGTWYAYPVITTAPNSAYAQGSLTQITTGSSSSYQWYLLPIGSIATFTVAATPTPSEGIAIDSSFTYSLSYNETTMKYTLQNLIVKITNNNASANVVIVEGHVTNIPDNTNITGGTTASIAAGASTNLNLQPTALSFDYGGDNLKASLQYYTSDDSTHKQSIVLNISEINA